jgi:hypothetical protein
MLLSPLAAKDIELLISIKITRKLLENCSGSVGQWLSKIIVILRIEAECVVSCCPKLMKAPGTILKGLHYLQTVYSQSIDTLYNQGQEMACI